MYNTFSDDYDRFVNWESRLAFELPFIEKTIAHVQNGDEKLKVLDAACGTGMHAIALSRHGYSVSGADLFPNMIERARQNAREAKADVRFEVAGFGSLAQAFGKASMNALVCLGNSLPHVEDETALQAALDDFARVLHPGGVLLLQNRNFDKVMAQKLRWMEPQAHREGDREWAFFRFYDFEPDGHIQFHIVTLYREGVGNWQQTLRATRLLPLLQTDLSQALINAGFVDLQFFGSMDGSNFSPEQSENLIIAARSG
jgi:ubiquinone/menaquinone biosynthesis C-methylase UbiE